MAMIVDVAGRDQCRDVAAGHGAVIFKAQLGPAVLMADRVPPLMSLYTPDRSDRDPAMVGVGVSHYPLRPVEQHQTGTPFGLDQPLPSGFPGGDLCDQGTEIVLVGGQLHQEPSHLVHIGDADGTQLIQVSEEMSKRAGTSADIHLSTISPQNGTRTGSSVL
jgi:hypothetical protein